MSSDQVDISGSCLCGGVRFEARQHDAPEMCHCSQCRKWAGHAWAAVGSKKLTIKGRKHLRWYRSSDDAERAFCAVCGSSLFWRQDGEKHIAISMGSIDPPTGMTLSGHIFTADKGDYYEIGDDLPQKKKG